MVSCLPSAPSSLCQGWSHLLCALAPFFMPCVKGKTALTLSPYLPVSPIDRNSQEEVKAHHIFLLPIRVPGVEYILNCVLWGMICAEETQARYLVGTFPFLGPKGKGGSVCKRGARKGTRGGGREPCMCVYVCVSWEEGGVFVNPQPTHRGNDFCPGRFISLQKVGKGEQLGFRGGCGV